MTRTKYGVIRQPIYPWEIRELLVVPHKDKSLTVSWSAFGPESYLKNVESMTGDFYNQSPHYRPFSHPQTGGIIHFTPVTTSESISILAYESDRWREYKFAEVCKPEIFSEKGLQLGTIVKTKEGVFVNPPKERGGNPTTNSLTLKEYLDKSKKMNGIWLYDKKDAPDFGFAPYETFEQKVQDWNTFVQGGLARVLEHTSEKIAQKFMKIVVPEIYKQGIDFYGFDEVEKPVLTVVLLDFGKDKLQDPLFVDGSRSIEVKNESYLLGKLIS